uniref:hypothetical protein n=1 Tax=Nocardia cyriacigeorgica TaxID=135487 RepID=UPI00245399BC
MVVLRPGTGFSRRALLRTSALGLVAAPTLPACSNDAGPALVRQRPTLTHGVPGRETPPARAPRRGAWGPPAPGIV